MARLKLLVPDQFFFSTMIPVRITDLNYGGHVGNDALLSIIHEARLQFLHHHGYSEMNLGGAALIMSDVAIEFKSEVFYGDSITVSVTSNDFTRVGFDLIYKLEKIIDDKFVLVAIAKTGMICYDYSQKKVTQLPQPVKEKLK